jgi:hypothetical protein
MRSWLIAWRKTCARVDATDQPVAADMDVGEGDAAEGRRCVAGLVPRQW